MPTTGLEPPLAEGYAHATSRVVPVQHAGAVHCGASAAFQAGGVFDDTHGETVLQFDVCLVAAEASHRSRILASGMLGDRSG